MTTVSRFVGKPVPRTDGPEKVTGSAIYTADVQIPGTAWGKVLRSRYPHARITSIDVSRARQVPGVHAVITGIDTGGALTGRRIFDTPVLAYPIVRFVGDPVAAVAAEDEETAARALELVGVEYEELPAVFDALEALRPGIPLLHPNVNAYKGLPKPLQEPSNLFSTVSWGAGDPDKGFREADFVHEATYTLPSVHQAYMEPHASLVHALPDGGMEVWSANKGPHLLKEQLAVTTGVPEERIHVRHVTIGGDFGGKGSPMQVAVVYYLSKAAGRPVRMVMDYTEELLASNPRHPATVRVRTGVAKDGTLAACHIEAFYNSGAYAGYKPLGFLPGARHAAGPYRIPHCRVDAHHIYTNRVPAGYMRGPGEPQAVFAMESHMDLIARSLGMDPAELRLKNVVRDGDANGIGEEYQRLHGAETIEAALEAAGWWEPKPAELTPSPSGGRGLRCGRGIAIGERAPGGGQTNARVEFQPGGTVAIYTSIFEQGSGTYTTLRQMAADILDVPLERVTLRVWDTDASDFDLGAGASRFSRMASAAVNEAATGAKQALFALAAERLRWPKDAIGLHGGELRNERSGATAALEDVLSYAPGPVGADARYDDMSRAHETAFTVQVAEVEVDPETGQVRLRKFTSVHDAGRVLNPQGHTGQINGGAMQGIGQALMEDLPTEDGRVTALSFADYKIPSIADIPVMQAIAIESGDGVGPFNVKGIGENPVIPASAAIANAIEDAAGVRLRDLPLTAEKVYRALQKIGPPKQRTA